MQDIDTAEGLHRLLHRCDYRSSFGHVGLNRQSLVVFQFNALDGLSRCLLDSIDGDHPRALAGVSDGRGLAVAPAVPGGAGAKHQCDLVL